MIKKHFTIKEILSDHWDDFLTLGYDLRPAIIKNLETVIHCCNPSSGHAVYFCSECRKMKYVPFRCKSIFCNTCGATYVAQRTENLSFKLINCSHRHLVFTIPAELRSFFQKDRSLLHVLFQTSSQTLLTWFYINASYFWARP